MWASRPTLTDTDLLSAIPDSPRHVEARAMLLRRTAAIIGEDAENCVLCDNETSLIVALGLPPRTIVARALACYPNAETLIANPEHANAFAAILEGWEYHPTRVHILDRLPRPSSRV